MPAALAAWSAGTTAFGSFAEIAIALTPFVVSSWMNEACASVAALGPTWVTVPPSSPAALSAPCFAASKYGLLICFGMNVTDSAPPAALPEALADASDEADADGPATLGAVVAAPELLLHAAAIRPATASRAASRPRRSGNNIRPPLFMDWPFHQDRPPTRSASADLLEPGRMPPWPGEQEWG